MRCRNEIKVDNTVLSLEEQTATDNIILQELCIDFEFLHCNICILMESLHVTGR